MVMLGLHRIYAQEIKNKTSEEQTQSTIIWLDYARCLVI